MSRIGSASEWREVRIALLRREKALSQLRDESAAQRRELLWIPVARDYRF